MSLLPRAVSARRLCLCAALAACSASADGEDPGSGSIDVPFELVRNQIVLEVEIDGHGPFNMLLDTAVNPSVVDLATAAATGLPVDRGDGGLASGVGSDRVEVFPVELRRLAIDGRPFEPISAVASDMSPLGARLGRPLHGILGYSFLRSRAVRIDYPGRRVEIFRGPAPPERTGGGLELPLTLDGTDVVIPVLVNDHRLSVTLDTGSSLMLEVYGHAAARIGIDTLRAAADTGTVRGARGEATILQAPVESIRIDGLAVPDPIVTFPERDRDVDGNLGNGFLRHFVLTVDYVAGRLRIAPAPAVGADGNPAAGPDPGPAQREGRRGDQTSIASPS